MRRGSLGRAHLLGAAALALLVSCVLSVNGDRELDGALADGIPDESVGGVQKEVEFGQRGVRRSLAVKGERGDGFWTVKGANYYDANGNRVWFAGVQWTGFEVDGCVHGLWTRNYVDMLRQIRDLGFNMLRLSFAGQTLDPATYPTTINYGINPDLQGLNSLQVMDKLIQAAGQLKLKIVLDYHRLYHTSHPEWGMWFDEDSPEELWLSNWEKLAKMYTDNPTVIGMDLFNEIHNNSKLPDAPVWDRIGEGEPYNWRTAVKRAADRIQNVNPNVLIIVEGMWYNAWWGGNLMYFTKMRPLPLMYPNKLVYSAHDYGPNVFDQPWYRGKKNFPDNLPGYWDRRWGYIVERHIAPVWIGEWGSALNLTLISNKTPREVLWAFKFRDYIREHQLSHTWFNWGPDSRDTGGLLKDDWWNVWEEKMELLKPVLHPNFGPSPGQPDVDDLPKKLSTKSNRVPGGHPPGVGKHPPGVGGHQHRG